MLAIIDGDVLCYLACNTERWKTKVMKLQDYDSGEQYLIRLDENGKRIPLEYSKEEDRDHLEKSWNNFQTKLNELLESVFCTEYLMAVKGDNNFRNAMFPEYKQNRHKDPTKQNIFVPVLRKLAVAEDFAIEAHGREADDLIRIWAEECRAHNIDYVICSIDKDLKCIPGKHWDMKKRELFTVSEAEALKFYYQQLIKGDATDNIPGVPGIGEVKSARILAPYDTEEDYQEQVVEQYMAAYGEDWDRQLLFNGKMIYLQKHYDDYFCFDEWPIYKSLKGAKVEVSKD
jgi:5'-3' exonuclease